MPTHQIEPDEVLDGVPVFNGKLEELGDDLAWQFNLSTGKNQEDKKWVTQEVALVQFLQRLFDHKATSKKNGACFMQGALISGAKQRTIPNVGELHFMVLDIDSGQPIDGLRQQLIQQDMFGIIYTTWSHGTTRTDIKKTELIDKLKLDQDDEVTNAHIKFYLQHYKRYDKSILDTCAYAGEGPVADKGFMVFVEHAPMEKYRIVLPLANSFNMGTVTNGNEKTARELWKRKYVGVAHQLGASYDRACTDVSRLFFWPTHPKDAKAEPRVEVVIGSFLDLATVEERDPRELEASNPFTEAGTGESDAIPLQTPWLKSWMRGKYEHFAAGDFFSNYYDQRNRNGDKITTECPFDGGHTDAGNPNDQGFFCTDGDGEKPFAAHCQHQSCADYRRLNFVDATIVEFGLTESDLDAFVPEGVVREAGDNRQPTEKLDALLSALPTPAELPVLPIRQVEEIMDAVAAQMTNGDGGAWVKAFEALKPYGRNKQALHALLNSAKARLKRGEDKDDGNRDDKRADAKLKELNKRYAVASLGGQVKIVDTKDPDGYSFMTDTAFKLLYANQRIQQGEKWVPVADEWLKWSERRTFEGVEFAPGGARPGWLNLFAGFAYRGKRAPGGEYGTGWCLLEEHIFENICRGDEEHYHWFMTWLADIIQNPDQKQGSCIILRGEQGVGKSIVFDLFRELLGKCALKIDSMERLTGRFNSCLSGNLFAQLEEGFFAGNHQAKSSMKNLVTGSTLYIERKGVEGWEEKNYTRVAMTSNDDWLMSMSRDDRRYFVLECGTGRQNDSLFFAKMWDEMRNGGFEAWMYDLQRWKPDADKGGWAMLRKPPRTAWAEAQITLSMLPEEKFFASWNDGDVIRISLDAVPIQRKVGEWTETDLSDFSSQFDAFMKQHHGSREKIANSKVLNSLCERHCPGFTVQRVSAGEGKKKRVYCFPPL